MSGILETNNRFRRCWYIKIAFEYAVPSERTGRPTAIRRATQGGGPGLVGLEDWTKEIRPAHLLPGTDCVARTTGSAQGRSALPLFFTALWDLFTIDCNIQRYRLTCLR